MNTFLQKQLQDFCYCFNGEFLPEKYTPDFISKFPFLPYFETNGIAYSIINLPNLKTECLSKNFYDVVGIRKEDYEKYDFTIAINYFEKEHSKFLTSVFGQFVKFWNAYSNECSATPDFSFNAIGLNFNHSQKGLIRLSISTFIIDFNESQKPVFVLNIFQDLTYMMKDEFYWIRYSSGNDNKYISVYHEAHQEILKDDIVTAREKEILKLIVQGRTTEEIAQQLFISKTTVNNHRQNMLNRIGVKDTTGLITIAKICKII